MITSGFGKLFWGFLFIMIDFRIQGVDILPDIVGFILFAVGFSALAEYSGFFKKAGKFNVFMIIVSVFYVYEQPAQGGGIHINPLGFLVGMVSLVLTLVVVYHLFEGIKEMVQTQEKMDLFNEAGTRWSQFLFLQLAAILMFILIFIPPLAILFIIILLVVSIIITVKIMGFMSRCGEGLS